MELGYFAVGPPAFLVAVLDLVGNFGNRLVDDDFADSVASEVDAVVLREVFRCVELVQF